MNQKLSKAERDKLLEELKAKREFILSDQRAINRTLGKRKLEAHKPWEKQLEFHNAGALYGQRLFMAGNRFGKTESACYELACHLTGIYPDWWRGKTFDDPVTILLAGSSITSIRDTQQLKLFGVWEDFGTGFLPKERIVGHTSSRGVPNAIDTAKIRHSSGGMSQILTRSYDMGRDKFQAFSADIVHLDEECPLDIYNEALARTLDRKGILILTFTPLYGMTELVRKFLSRKLKDMHITTMTIDDMTHLSPEEKQAWIDKYEEGDPTREARLYGVPAMGQGRVYPIADSMIMETAIPIPDHWPRICGLDFGWDHPTAAVWLAWDRDSDTIHLYDCYKRREATPSTHAEAIKARGDWIPVAWPHDGLIHDKGSGVQIRAQYKNQGVNMLVQRAQFPDGSNGIEAGVYDILQRMQAGRFKVAAHLSDWFDEFRGYYRKDGKIVADYDDLMAATRYAVMMLRFAKTNSNYDWFMADRYNHLNQNCSSFNPFAW